MPRGTGFRPGGRASSPGGSGGSTPVGGSATASRRRRALYLHNGQIVLYGNFPNGGKELFERRSRSRSHASLLAAFFGRVSAPRRTARGPLRGPFAASSCAAAARTGDPGHCAALFAPDGSRSSALLWRHDRGTTRFVGHGFAETRIHAFPYLAGLRNIYRRMRYGGVGVLPRDIKKIPPLCPHYRGQW